MNRTTSHIQKLEEFNEKTVEMFEKRQFIKFLKESEKLTSDGITEILHDDIISAFMLDIRFFFNKRDIAIETIAESYEILPISSEIKKQFFDWRTALDSYLDKKITMTLYGNTPSQKDVLYTFLYGHYAHYQHFYPRDPTDYKKIYDSWRKDKISFPLLMVHLFSILNHLLVAICSVSYLNKQALIELKQP
jgi:hypothetical protein